MKKRFLMTAALVLALVLAACGGQSGSAAPTQAPSPASNTPAPALTESARPAASNAPTESARPADSAAPAESGPVPQEGGKTMVIYFSCTSNTRAVAETIAGHVGAELYELVPAEPYSSADLNWHDSKSRSSVEMNDPAARPAIAGALPDLTGVDTVFLGYPIWWGEAPRIINTLLERVDLGGRTVVPFCTSSSSGMGASARNLHGYAPGANWLDGRRFPERLDAGAVTAWVDGLGLK